MPKYRLAVCEDDNTIRKELCGFLKEILDAENIDSEITDFSCAEDLEKFIKEKGDIFSLLILDIEMGEKSGLELALELRESMDDVSILFVTGYDTYLKNGYEVQPINYLIKPVDRDQLRRVVLKDWQMNHRPKSVLFERGGRKLSLPLSDILYAEPDGKHGVHFMLRDGSADFSVGLSEVEKKLPEGQFIRCHHSYIVNLEHVREINKQTFYLKDGQSVPISRKYYAACQDAFVAYRAR